MYALDVESLPDERAGTAEQEAAAAERHAALREAFTQLPTERPAAGRPAHRGPADAVRRDQRQLGIPVGSIGPTRSRYLDKMRRHPAIAALINA